MSELGNSPADHPPDQQPQQLQVNNAGTTSNTANNNPTSLDIPEQAPSPENAARTIPLIPALPFYQAQDDWRGASEFDPGSNDYSRDIESYTSGEGHNIDSSFIINLKDSQDNEFELPTDNYAELSRPVVNIASSSAFDYPTFKARASAAPRNNSGLCPTDKTDFFFKQVQKNDEIVKKDGTNTVDLLASEAERDEQGANNSMENNFMTGFAGYVDGDCERRTQLYVSSTTDNENAENSNNNVVTIHQPESENTPDLEAGGSHNYFAHNLSNSKSLDTNLLMTDSNAFSNISAAQVVPLTDMDNILEHDGSSSDCSSSGNESYIGIGSKHTKVKIKKGFGRNYFKQHRLAGILLVILVSAILVLGIYMCKKSLKVSKTKSNINSDNVGPPVQLDVLSSTSTNSTPCMSPITIAATTVSAMGAVTAAVVISLCCCADCCDEDDATSLNKSSKNESTEESDLGSAGFGETIGQLRQLNAASSRKSVDHSAELAPPLQFNGVQYFNYLQAHMGMKDVGPMYMTLATQIASVL